MFRPLRYIKAVAAALAIVAALPAFASHPRHNGNGTWTFHSTFDNELRKIPYMLIVGEKEAENGEVSVRRQGEGDKGTMKVAEFAALINDAVKAQTEHQA